MFASLPASFRATVEGVGPVEIVVVTGLVIDMEQEDLGKPTDRSDIRKGILSKWVNSVSGVRVLAASILNRLRDGHWLLEDIGW